MDSSLPFGLWLAPKIFMAVTDALQRVMLDSGVLRVEHYLDNFVTLGSLGSSECGRNLERILAVCADLGVPLAMDKLMEPTDCLTFLGIELDTQVGVMQILSPQGPAGAVVRAEVMSKAAAGVTDWHAAARLPCCEAGKSIPETGNRLASHSQCD